MTPIEIYLGLSTLGTLLYGTSHLLAKFGKPKWATRFRKLSNFVDILGANHGKSVNLIDNGKTEAEIQLIQAVNRHRDNLQ